MKIKERFIVSIGIPKTVKCPACGRKETLDICERKNIAECIVNNSAGLWALNLCGNCGYTYQIFPKMINAVPCTKEECEKLFEELKKYEAENGEMKEDETEQIGKDL